MKKLFALSAFAFCTFASSALATCPTVDGKYTYTCTVEKDPDAEFGAVLDVNGQMFVQQAGCDAYRFYNPVTGITEEFLLNDPSGRVQGKIKKSTANVIKFKTVEHVSGLKRWVEKGTIRTEHNGFSLDGKERSRVLAIFGSRHSKFSCDFRIQN